MAYQINRFDGSILTVVEDGTIDQSTDLLLVGKNFAGYGEVQNENFVFLLENFAGLNPPAQPLSGQIWYDSDTSKLKFYDGSRFRTTGGAEISAAAPSGLTQGDFWWDTENEQLFAYNGTDFVLIGPQDAGEGITQMQSRSVTGTDGISRSVIVSIIDDAVVHVISNEAFSISQTPGNSIPGFDVIKRGVTLVNTIGSTGGVTSTDHIFWGTASNANQLGGIDADQFVQAGEANFNSLVEFNDVGIAIGDSLDLRVFIENDNQAVISNEVGNRLSVRIKDISGINKTPLRIFADSVLPGLTSSGDATEEVDLGSETHAFSEIFAENFTGLSEKSTALVVDGENRVGSVSTQPNTVAVRDASGDLRANLFNGTALQAKYADLAEIYKTDSQLPIGTVVAVCDHGDHEVCAESATSVIGVISEHPAYLMNSESEGQAVALKGRVPVRITGPITKGEKVFAQGNGTANTSQSGDFVGISLASSDTKEEKLIECVLKV